MAAPRLAPQLPAPAGTNAVPAGLAGDAAGTAPKRPGRGAADGAREEVATTRAPRVLGLDLSLTSTGIASNIGGGWTDTIRPRAKMRGLDRLTHIRGRVLDHATGVDLVVVEGPSYGSSGAGSHERAGLWWLVVHALSRRNVAYAIASPKSRAQYATGMGDANKREVVAAITAYFPWFDATRRVGLDDECDALALAALGADWLGVPMVAMPQTHRAGLTGVEWPALACEVAA